MDEFQIIHRIKQKQYRQPSLIKGVGDDAAVFRTNEDIVTAVDTFIEGVHFSSKTMNYFHVGYRALAANVSDMAAMGAMPSYYLVSIVIPKYINEEQVFKLFEGMDNLASMYNMDLIGGDTVSGDILSISITIMGTVQKDKARYRHDAQINDIVFVTGTLGDASCGLHILLNDMEVANKDYFIERHRMPSPRVSFAQQLNKIPRVSLNDISDGIANELNEIATASNVAIIIDEQKIPMHTSIKHFPNDMQFTWKFFGGEDFELVGTISKEYVSFLYDAAKKSNTKITVIGEVISSKEKNRVFLQQNERIFPLEKKGYIHLK